METRSGPGGAWVVLAEREAERELLAFCRAERAGTLVLDGAYYPVDGLTLIVPENLSPQGAHRLCEAFERAATSHQRATMRRKRFQVVDEQEPIEPDK